MLSFIYPNSDESSFELLFAKIQNTFTDTPSAAEDENYVTDVLYLTGMYCSVYCSSSPYFDVPHQHYKEDCNMFGTHRCLGLELKRNFHQQ